MSELPKDRVCDCAIQPCDLHRKLFHEETTPRPVETRPPAPTLDTCPFYTNGQHSWGLGARCKCGQFRAPKPVEQAAPPRPFDLDKALADSLAMNGRAPAAIEQARPQPPEICRYCLQTRIPIDVRLTLERERTKVCDGVNAIKKALHSRSWLTEGRGSYTYDDDRWMDEFASAIQEIKTALVPLERIAGDHSNCPIETSEIIEARKPIATAAAEPAPERTPPQEIPVDSATPSALACGHSPFNCQADCTTCLRACIRSLCQENYELKVASTRAVAVPEPAQTPTDAEAELEGQRIETIHGGDKKFPRHDPRCNIYLSQSCDCGLQPECPNCIGDIRICPNCHRGPKSVAQIRCPNCQQFTPLPEDRTLDFSVTCQSCNHTFKVRTSQ